MNFSANLNVMVKAARSAGRSLVKDFREVENLQVSAKGPGDFVSRADIAAEKIIRDILTEARPRLDRRGVRAGGGQGPHPPLARRPARRHHQLPPRPAALVHLDRSRAQGRRGRGRHLRPGQGRAWPRRGRGPG